MPLISWPSSAPLNVRWINPILEYIEKQPFQERTRFTRILEGHEERAARMALPNEGAEACLFTLKEMGIPFGIITRNSLKSVMAALQQFDDFEFDDFEAVVTREAAPPKPHPAGVFEAAARMGCSVQEILVVGDFRFDVIAGKRAGAKNGSADQWREISHGAGRSETGLMSAVIFMRSLGLYPVPSLRLNQKCLSRKNGASRGQTVQSQQGGEIHLVLLGDNKRGILPLRTL